MSALPWIKYDNGPFSGNGSITDLPTNCFPVRNLLKSSASSRKKTNLENIRMFSFV